MSRLKNRAFKILRAELQNCTGTDAVSKVEQEIVLKRLEKLRKEKGLPVGLEELRETIVDEYPHFSDKVLRAAARANRPPGMLDKIKWTAIGLGGAAGVLWVLNLPYPVVRLPVARTAPILLLPSYISMDYHYRKAIALGEQADQLVNRASSSADLTLGEVKVKQAQQHLDALPLWFVDEWPRYTYWFGLQYSRAQLDTARGNVGRMEAQLFQEKNAQTQLSQAQQALKSAKEKYYKAQNSSDKQIAIASWQIALNQLEQIPSRTLAGQTNQSQLVNERQDYRQVTQLAAQSDRTNTLIAASQQFAQAATQAALNPPHSVEQWQRIIELWQQAASQLQQISSSSPGYVEVQKLLVAYQTNLAIAETQLQAEQGSVQALEQSKNQIASLLSADNSAASGDRVASQLSEIITQLETVKPGTTAYAEAQDLLKSAKQKLK